MTTISRFVPFRSPLHDVAVLQNRLNSIFQDFTRPEGNEHSEAFATGSFLPPVDIFEDPQRVTLKLEIPGIKQEDLELQVENNTLTVKGERKFESDQKEENAHRIERRFGTFSRTFTLPPTVETESINAQYDAGVLNIQIPKKAEAKPKQIKIQVGNAQSGPRQVEASSKPTQNVA